MAVQLGNIEIIELLAHRQSQPPDPEDQQSHWPCLINRVALLQRL
jgi:hypothetical protein